MQSEEKIVSKKRKRKSEVENLTNAWFNPANQASTPGEIKKGEVVWFSEDKDIAAVSQDEKYLYFKKSEIKDSDDLAEGKIVEMEYPRESVITNTENTQYRTPNSVKLTNTSSPISTTRKKATKNNSKVNLKNGSKVCQKDKKGKQKKIETEQDSSDSSEESKAPVFKYKAILDEESQKPRKVVRGKRSKIDEESIKKKKKNPVLSVCTWNINHLSDNTKVAKAKAQSKEKALISILEEYAPDIIVVQEINLLSTIAREEWIVETKDEEEELVYDWSSGPLLKAGNFLYKKRFGTQYEYYAIAFNKDKIKVIDEVVVLTFDTWDQVYTQDTFVPIKPSSYKKSESGLEWKEHRPLVVYVLQLIETGDFFAVGIVHTSPSFHVEISSWEYIRAMQARFNDIPWMLAGDWYVKESTKIFMLPTKEEKTWSNILSDYDLKYIAPDDNTNYPKDHEKGKKKKSARKTPEGMVADYIVTDDCWELQDGTEVDLVRTDYITDENLENNVISDHSPVIATFELDVTKKKK